MPLPKYDWWYTLRASVYRRQGEERIDATGLAGRVVRPVTAGMFAYHLARAGRSYGNGY